MTTPRLEGRGFRPSPAGVPVSPPTQSAPFDWLTELYSVWARIEPAQVHAAATAGLGWLALSGCSTSTDHGELRTADITAAAREVRAARRALEADR